MMSKRNLQLKARARAHHRAHRSSRSLRLESLEDRRLMTAVPALNSLPGASASLYLDFDGHFEASWGSYSNITTPAYDSDGNPASFSSAEIDFIEDVWRVVAEDYAPFNINVTTVEPAVLASGVPSSQANGIALRVAIGGNGLWKGQETGGYAYINSFTSVVPNVAYVFTTASSGSQMSGLSTANTAAHEAGHSFGLLHNTDPDGTNSYYDMETRWQALMSSANLGYDDTTWFNGLAEGDVPQDDMAMIARPQNVFGYRADDHANTISGATPLPTVGSTFVGQGVISVISDVDVFSINTSGPRSLKISVTGSEIGQNLDAVVELLDAAGNLLVRSDPASSYDAVLYGEVNGTQYIAVRASGGYGRVGQYQLTVEDSTPGVTFATSTSEPFTTSELGRSESFTLNLQTKPATDVVFNLASSDTTEGTVSTQQVTFTPTNWYMPQTMQITGVSDSVYDGDQGFSVAISASASEDPIYAGLFSGTVLDVVNLDSAPGQLFSLRYQTGKDAQVQSLSRLDHTNATTVDMNATFGAPTGGYTLARVAVDALHGKVYWTESRAYTIYRSNLDGSAPESVVAGLPGLAGIAIDAAAGKLYWADSRSLKIQRANLDGTGVEDLLATGPSVPKDLQLDITAGKIYWAADGGTYGVYRANLNGSQVEGLVATTAFGRVDALVVDGTQGKMYFSAWNANQPTRLYRANLDGSDAGMILENTGHMSTAISRMTLDEETQRIYFNDGRRIYSVDTNGQHLALVVQKNMARPNANVSGLAYVAAQPGISVSPTVGLETGESGGVASFAVSLSAPPTAVVIISLASSDTTEGLPAVSSLTFTSANWNVPQTVQVAGVDDAIVDGDVAYHISLTAASADARYNGLSAPSVSVTNLDDDVLPTKFYVVNDATQNLTYEYDAAGGLVESYTLNSGNSAPRGAASTSAGDKTWVVDANRKVYVYDNQGALLGSWTAGTLASNATVEGIATNGTDVWIVDARSDKVYKYTGAATRLSGSQNAASSFNLNSSNTSPKDIVTDGTSLWVVNDSTTDKVFKYSASGSLAGSWTISNGGGKPTGITLDPSNATQDIWIADSNTDKVYQYAASRSRTSGSQAAAAIFSLAAGNTNPQGIADPPAPGTTQLDVTGASEYESAPESERLAWRGVDAIHAPTVPGRNATARVVSRSAHSSRTVDEVMNAWGHQYQPGVSVAGGVRNAPSPSGRATRVMTLDSLDGEMDAAIELLASELAATQR